MFEIFKFLMLSSNFFVFIFPFLIYFSLNYKSISKKTIKEFFIFNFISILLFYLLNFSFKALCLFPLNYRKYLIFLYIFLIILQLIILIFAEKEKFLLLLFPTILVNFWFFMASYTKCPLYNGIIDNRAYMLFFIGIIGMLVISIISWIITIKLIIFAYKNREILNRVIARYFKKFFDVINIINKR